jgi:hypothetical protein
MNPTNKTQVTKHGRVNIATVVAMALLSACSGPLPVPVQTLPQQKSEPTFADRLRELLPGRAPAQPKVEPGQASETYPSIVWPAPGAGDFPPGWYMPEVVWPAPGAGDFPPGWYLPEVVWPPPGTEVVAPAPASQKAGEDLRDRHPNLSGLKPAGVPAGDDLLDRHPRPVVLERAYWLLRPVYEANTQVRENTR